MEKPSMLKYSQKNKPFWQRFSQCSALTPLLPVENRMMNMNG